MEQIIIGRSSWTYQRYITARDSQYCFENDNNCQIMQVPGHPVAMQPQHGSNQQLHWGSSFESATPGAWNCLHSQSTSPSLSDKERMRLCHYDLFPTQQLKPPSILTTCAPLKKILVRNGNHHPGKKQITYTFHVFSSRMELSIRPRRINFNIIAF